VSEEELVVKVWTETGEERWTVARLPQLDRIIRASQAYRRRTPWRLPGQSELLALALMQERTKSTTTTARWLIARDAARRLERGLKMAIEELDVVSLGGTSAHTQQVIDAARDLLRVVEEQGALKRQARPNTVQESQQEPDR